MRIWIRHFVRWDYKNMLNQFSRTELLLGKAAMERLAECRVAVFGIGGVGGSVSEPVRENSSEPTAEAVSAMDENGHLIIYADKLSSERISFIWVSDDSRIELLTRVGDDGMVKATLGTCQSCNGSPRAYYTQEGDKLKCNNCGLTFPISVLDNPGGGCHPIMLDETLLQYQGNDLVMDLSSLLAYEYLFSKVVNH